MNKDFDRAAIRGAHSARPPTNPHLSLPPPRSRVPVSASRRNELSATSDPGKTPPLGTRRHVPQGGVLPRLIAAKSPRRRDAFASTRDERAPRNRRTARTLILAVWLAFAALSSMTIYAADGAKGYEAYKVVRTRNIFDPNRKVVRIEAPRPSTPPRPRSSTFTLTGTMVREGKSLAFFGGSRSEFSKVISVGDSVANYKITAIEPAQVELEHEGKKVTLTIGKPFQIEAKPGDPEPAEEPAPAPDGTPATSATDGAAPPAPAAPPAGGDAKSEILRRMMERRAKEMGK